MIKDDMTPFQCRVQFRDAGIERTHYADDRRYYEQLIAQHGHLSELRIEPVVLTAEQRQRLDEVRNAGLSGHDASVYVRYGSTESADTAFYDAAKLVRYQHDQVEPVIKAQRQAAEAVGVTHGGLRYDGDPSNRQAMQEALTAAADGGLSVFATWKGSSGTYLEGVPVTDVEAALRKIGQRRSHLIGLEAQYVAQAAAGDVDASDLDWSTPFDG